MPDTWTRLPYALAMGVDAIAALVLGRWFDRFGLGVLVVATVLSAGFAPLRFGSRREFAILGTILWGIGMGAQESIMRAAVANMTSPTRRATAYGVFNLAYGVAWFAGSGFMGWIYPVARLKRSEPWWAHWARGIVILFAFVLAQRFFR
jgi:MFS-type transporter involved in bile tolerance (Atg22 family)